MEVAIILLISFTILSSLSLSPHRPFLPSQRAENIVYDVLAIVYSDIG